MGESDSLASDNWVWVWVWVWVWESPFSWSLAISLAITLVTRSVECLPFLFKALARPFSAALFLLSSTYRRSSFNLFCVQPVLVGVRKSKIDGFRRVHCLGVQRAHRASLRSSSGISQSVVRHMMMRSMRYAPVSSAVRCVVSPRNASVHNGRAGNSAITQSARRAHHRQFLQHRMSIPVARIDIWTLHAWPRNFYR